MTEEQSNTATAITTADAPPKKPRLEQLDGFRFIVAFWLVIAHNYNNTLDSGTVYHRFCLRRYVAVSFFLVLSGFVSQYAYGTRDFNSSETLRKFYVGRFGSILACYYATTAVSLVIRAIFHHYNTTQWAIGVPLVTTLLQCWVPRYAYFGNTPAWTMSTLAAHWLAFPFLQPRLIKVTDRVVLWVCILVPVLACIPVSLALALEGGSLASRQWYMFYTLPLLRFPDFVYGAALAELYVRGYRPKYFAYLSDLAFPVVFMLVLFVPYTSRKSVFDSLMIFAPMHLFGLLVYGSSCDPSKSFTARFFSLEVCRKLGDFAFQVYLWRWPIFAWVQWIQDGYLKRGHMYLAPNFFVPSLIFLYGFSYVWYRYVDNPLRLHLSKVTAPNLEPQIIEPNKDQPQNTDTTAPATTDAPIDAYTRMV